MESFFNSLKNERVHRTRYATHDAARADQSPSIPGTLTRSYASRSGPPNEGA